MASALFRFGCTVTGHCLHISPSQPDRRATRQSILRSSDGICHSGAPRPQGLWSAGGRIADVAGLCDHQGCNSKFYSRIGAVACGKGNSRKRRGSRADLDAAHTFYHAAGCGCELRQTSADEAAGSASRACDYVRHAGGSAFELRFGCDDRSDWWQTNSLTLHASRGS
jgi:hypothetical protein